MCLSGKYKRVLKSILKTRPIDLKLGKKGLTENFIQEARKISSTHGLIKVNLQSDKKTRKEQTHAIEQILGAEMISSIGKTVSFFVKNHDPNRTDQARR